MIKSFSCKETEKIFEGVRSKKLPLDIQKIARRKLVFMNEALSLSDISSVPANRLEKLKGDRKGQYSIRINNQWRICFDWDKNELNHVEIIDYH